MLFVYGLVFFVLGLAVALHSRRHSRLVLARRLRWLIAFGLLHGLYEWGDVFIPIQHAYLSDGPYQALLVIQVALLGLSFACLLQFGVDLFRPLPPRLKWLRRLPLALFLLWAGTVAAALAFGGQDVGAVLIQANRSARYLLCVPGAIVAAVGLWRQAPRLVAPLHDERSLRLLRVAASALAAYALAAGLVVPPGPTFPASVVNTSTFLAAAGVPVYVFRSLLGLVLVVAVLRMLELFQTEVDERVLAMEEWRTVSLERERLARDLHDRTLQAVYAAGLTLNACMARQSAAGCPDGAEDLARGVAVLDRAVADIREHIAELHSAPQQTKLADSLTDLVNRSAVASMAGVDLDIDLPSDLQLAAQPVSHVLGVVSEALSNIARHANARRVSVTAAIRDGALEVTITDDGVGIPKDYVAGFGISDMHQRARLLGAELSIHSGPSSGTRLQLVVPLAEMQR